MTVEAEQTISITTQGDVREDEKDLALARMTQLCEQQRSPVLFAEVKLSHEPDPARDRPFIIEGLLSINGDTVRAHVAADSMTAAIDLLDDRLRRRIERSITRRAQQRHRSAGRTTEDDHEWHHGDLPTQRPEYFDRPADERELVRHKTFAVHEMSPDEAADLLDLLGHDFLLFTNLNTTADAVLWYSSDNGLELIDASGRDEAIDPKTVTPMVIGQNAARHCTCAEAIEELDLDLEPFVFFVDPDTGRGQVAYHRHDGHYGLISPA